MSSWTHRCCVDCWMKFFMERFGPDPVTLNKELCPEVEPCCFCGVELHNDGRGIYVREDPAILRCRGEHGQG